MGGFWVVRRHSKWRPVWSAWKGSVAMKSLRAEIDVSQEDVPLPEVRLGRFTWRQVILLLGGWLVIFAVGSVFVSNPFITEASAGATPNYGNVMYLHALLIGLVGLVGLVTCEVFKLRSRLVRTGILAAAVGATVLTGLGGIFDTTVSSSVSIWLILHVIGFFLLDAIFLLLFVGFYLEWRQRSPRVWKLTFGLAALAALSLEFAAAMGHIAGWILDFGDHPRLIGSWATAMGETVGDLRNNLITSHSHEMVVALLALIVALAAERFGYQALSGGRRTLARVGMWLAVAGTALMTIQYVVGGVTSHEPPTLFRSGPGGVNGLASDDLVTGLGVMLGGLLVLLALVAGRNNGKGKISESRRASSLGIAWSWLLLFVTVPVAGYYIELNEKTFGAGSPAPRAVSDGIFTWFHQDFAFFLLPALMVLMLIADLYLTEKASRLTMQGILLGTLVIFVGFMTYVFVSPVIYGAGYVLVAVGSIVTALAVGRFLWELQHQIGLSRDTDRTNDENPGNFSGSIIEIPHP